MWAGPLVMASGTDLTVKGSGVLDGQGPWYWKYGPSITRPVFFRLQNVITSKVSGFTIKNMLFRTFSVVACKNTVLSGLTIDSRAGDGIAKNTDGFDLSKNDGVTITGNTIYNQDDCLAMQSSTNTVFRKLLQYARYFHRVCWRQRCRRFYHGAGSSTTRLRTMRNAIVIHSDYSKENGRYMGIPTSQVQITGITVPGLTGSSTNLYDIQANPNMLSIWTFVGIKGKASQKDLVSGLPKGLAI
ncbi:unnamed protein product [Hyaloperonospora brassicae]|uniref:Pectate lyase domain-containing protein n=1 Tax=Hyaloperonospora brassicae TaxID=162125 RepID=A0AAV0V116_HYABA|nr:unnamed protein product [Hyaloperonospora brassicae]